MKKYNIISLSGTHMTGKTYLLEKITSCNDFIPIKNIFRKIIEDTAVNEYNSRRIQILALNKFIDLFKTISKDKASYVTDRFILDPIAYGLLHGIKIDYKKVLIEVLYNLYKGRKDVIVYSTVYGEKIGEIFDYNTKFFSDNLFNDSCRNKTVSMGDIYKAMNLIRNYESIYLDLIKIIDDFLYIRIINLSDLVSKYNNKDIINLFNIRNNLVIEDLKNIKVIW